MKCSYKRYLSGSGSLLLLMLALIVSPACAANGMSGMPQINITEPKDGSEIAAGNVTVSVEVMNFNLANKLGKANVAGEGHIHWFMDAKTPTAPGKNAKAKQGRNAPSSAAVDKSYTWTNVAVGMHNFSVELVNNDHTPLSPPVVAEVNVTAKDETLKTMSMENVTVGLIAKSIAFNTSTITVPAGARVTVNFDNQDANVPHNFAVYDSANAKTTIFKGNIITGPKMIAYTFDAPTTPGTYFFRCDIHPTIMTGKFVVE
ncbi:MAG: cupredoxin domain-containing protein [Methanothrix sp.]|nr:cupredoxin domain-containing protein [Methanothrix sp.]